MRILAIAIALVSFAPALRADDDKPLGYPVPAVYPTPDGKHTFVLIPPVSTNPKRRENAQQQALREKYPTSGMYAPNVEKPLWTVDWYAYDAFPANDAIHVVRIHGDSLLSRHFIGGRRLPDEKVVEQIAAPAVSFYDSGKLIRTYSVREIVGNPDALPHSIEDVLWMAGAVITVDDKQFGLTTQDSRQLFFELETGKIAINREAGLGNAQVWVIRFSLLALGISLLVLLGVFIYQQRMKP